MKPRIVVTGALAGTAVLLSPVFAHGQPTSTPVPPSSSPAEPPDHTFLGLSPQRGEPGDQVLVSVGCPPKLLRGTESAALDIGPLKVVPDPGTSPRSEAVAKVRKAAKPGRHPVRAFCGTATLAADFTVTAAEPPRPPERKPGAQVPVKPKGAPQTGGGATSPDRQEGTFALVQPERGTFTTVQPE
ncbi:hypothetical protein [Amycolatopsis anabasis]|uniref:hypothetical protein n=1 Tax=Amycolatopsis anabasis TaxID=1840409 RepID=UPI00131C519B|nr:hypothetical protein [Amycolatopsis anabasis]